MRVTIKFFIIVKGMIQEEIKSGISPEKIIIGKTQMPQRGLTNFVIHLKSTFLPSQLFAPLGSLQCQVTQICVCVFS